MSKKEFLDDEGTPAESLVELSEKFNSEIADMYKRYAEDHKNETSYDQVIGASMMTISWLLSQIIDEVAESENENYLQGVMAFFLDMLGTQSPLSFVTLVKEILNRAEEAQEDLVSPMEKVRKELKKVGIVAKEDDEVLH